jgi:hypothetical protein
MTIIPTRLPDWQTRLQACLAARWDQPFVWGRQDCCIFVADCAKAITGQDPAADLRGTYADEASAARLLKRLGGVRAIGAARFGLEIAPAFAQVGDIGLVHNSGRDSLALCGGSGWLAPGALQLERLPLDAALVAWRIT